MITFKKELLESLGNQLNKKKQTLAVAESVTSGLIQFALSSIPDAAGFYQGGLTVYNVGQKYRHLCVEPIHALSVNCVSEKVATEMAINVCDLYCSDWGLGVTGYATPVQESGNKIYAYYAIAYRKKLLAKGKINTAGRLPAEIQLHYAETVLKKLLDQ